MSDDVFEPLPGEGKADQFSEDDKKKAEKEDRVRNAIADVYTFVRSRDINKTIAAFTFDHYIDEAVRDIEGTTGLEAATGTSGIGRAVRDAEGQVVDIRPSKLEQLEKIKQNFIDNFEAAMKMATEADDTTEAP